MKDNKACLEYEIELLEEDLIEIGERLDTLANEDADLKNDLLANQAQIIRDLAKANTRLQEENRCLRRQNKFLDY